MLDKLTDIALEAGAAILAVYAREDFAARAKDDGSPVTDADAAAEALILARLRALYPDIPVVAEEEAAAGAIAEAGTRFFLVDPLDGTKEFLSRNGDFTVNIALIEEGRPVCGVVYAPAHGLIYVGDDRAGARMADIVDGAVQNWRPISVRCPPQDGLAVIASRSHMSPETSAFVEKFPVAELVSAGSSLKFCRVAAGEADLYPRLGRTMEWDTAAGDAVLRAAGGRVCTMSGEPLLYGKRRQSTDVDYANPWFIAAGRFDPFPA
jgi:3'(2'),5'-bisphosphate nucleotidase